MFAAFGRVRPRHRCHVALSVAVGATFPGDGQTADELVACADRAMYEAKGGLARNGREPGAPVPSRVP